MITIYINYKIKICPHFRKIKILEGQLQLLNHLYKTKKFADELSQYTFLIMEMKNSRNLQVKDTPMS